MNPIPPFSPTGAADIGAKRSKPQMRWPRVTALAGVCALALAWSEASARPSPDAAAVTRSEWQRKCERRAEQNNMRPKLRRPFIKQCVAGYRINGRDDLQDKKEKF